MSYIFDLEKIQEGDILLINVDPQLSKTMENSTGSPFHHAMLYVGGSSYIDSNKGPGVQAMNTQRILFDNKEAAIALRLKGDPDDEIIQNAVGFVRDKVGTEYSFAEARKVLASSKGETLENRQFCTRLVAQAYAHAGMDLVQNPDYCSPRELMDSKQLILIDDILIAASDDEIAFAKETDTVLDQQMDANNKILAEVRRITGTDIQTLNQVTEYLVSHPEHDQEITDVVSQSPYLHFWENEMEKHPYRYDSTLFLETVPPAAWPSFLDHFEGVYNDNMFRYMTNLIAYENLYEHHQLSYFGIHIDLYRNLVDMTERLGAVLMVIKVHLATA